MAKGSIINGTNSRRKYQLGTKVKLFRVEKQRN
jgi:hypothetical protein